MNYSDIIRKLHEQMDANISSLNDLRICLVIALVSLLICLVVIARSKKGKNNV